jgi:transcriptional regulator with XRE-family HTH domain
MSLVPLIAARLRELRSRHLLTQEEAAELIGVSMRFYQHIESGKKKQIWLETVERLGVAFGLEVWEFLGPNLPVTTEVQHKVAESKIHYASRRGPYAKKNTKQ